MTRCPPNSNLGLRFSEFRSSHKSRGSPMRGVSQKGAYPLAPWGRSGRKSGSPFHVFLPSTSRLASAWPRSKPIAALPCPVADSRPWKLPLPDARTRARWIRPDANGRSAIQSAMLLLLILLGTFRRLLRKQNQLRTLEFVREKWRARRDSNAGPSA